MIRKYRCVEGPPIEHGGSCCFKGLSTPGHEKLFLFFNFQCGRSKFSFFFFFFSFFFPRMIVAIVERKVARGSGLSLTIR